MSGILTRLVGDAIADLVAEISPEEQAAGVRFLERLAGIGERGQGPGQPVNDGGLGSSGVEG